MQINHFTVRSARIHHSLTLALCADFHNGNFAALRPLLAEVDAILIVGDLVDRHARRTNGYDNALTFLAEAPRIAPTFYAIGNHERKFPLLAEYWPHVEGSAVTVLDDAFVEFKGIVLGGLTSREKPDPSWLADMADQPGFKLLMCHHPEYFPQHIAGLDIDLTVSGHAHGGQVRLGRQGLYAPGQGILPRLTSGFYHDDHLLVSRGLTNATWAPRINCGCELILLHLEAQHAQRH